jgi:hypothetical protein
MVGFPVSSVMTPVGMMGMPLGIIKTGVPTVLVGAAKMPIAVMGMSFSTPHPWGGIPPKPVHPPSPVVLNCSMTVLAMMKPVAHVGSILACKHMCLPFPPNLTVMTGP